MQENVKGLTLAEILNYSPHLFVNCIVFSPKRVYAIDAQQAVILSYLLKQPRELSDAERLIMQGCDKELYNCGKPTQEAIDSTYELLSRDCLRANIVDLF